MLYYNNIMILWDFRHICGPSLTEVSLCDAWLVNEDESRESSSLSVKWCWNKPAWVHTVWHKQPDSKWLAAGAS